MFHTLGENWILTPDNTTDAQLAKLRESLGVGALCARTLAARGYADPAKAKSFLNKTDLQLYDPFLLRDMDKAVARIRAALDNREPICIYGDYDVDGVTATTALFTYLRVHGADCDCFIPERLAEGYGLNKQAIENLSHKAKLLITVDTGTTAVEEAAYARSLGVDVVITDHHSCREELPEAVALVNPHRPDCPYPFKSLAGVGVVFKLLCALETNLCGDSEQATARIFASYADITAIGTVADVMPVIDENRLIVDRGLRSIEHTERKGLLALLRHAGVYRDGIKKQISTATIGFALAPRLNAAGRISSARKALDLFLAETDEQADSIAAELCEINKQRQMTEQDIYTDAIKQICDYGSSPRYSYVLSSDHWHQGVVGVVASKISEKYFCPAILFSFDGDLGKGSGRSVKEFSLMDALSYCSDLLVEYGGHELAAGLSIERKNLQAFTERFEEYSRRQLEGKSVVPPVELDCPIDFREVTLKDAEDLLRLEPYGLSNPVPLFLLKNVVLSDIASVGDDRHVRLRLRGRNMPSDQRDINGIYFGMSHSEFPYCRGDLCDLACSLTVNEYNGSRYPQLLIRAARPCEGECDSIRVSRSLYEEVFNGTDSLPANVLPSVEDFRTVFRVLKREFGDTRKRMSVRWLQHKILQTEERNIDLCALKVTLDVLVEFNLAECVRIRGEDIVEIRLLPYGRKIDLEQSDILRRIKHRLCTGA